MIEKGEPSGGIGEQLLLIVVNIVYSRYFKTDLIFRKNVHDMMANILC